MKRKLTGLILLLLLLGNSMTGWGQNFSAQFLERVPKKMVSVATVNSSMIETLKKGESHKELLSFLNELSFLRVITINTQTKRVVTIGPTLDANYYCDMAITQARQYAQGEELLSSSDNLRQTFLFAFNKTADNKFGEILFINCDDDILTIVNLTGSISINKLGDLSKLSNSIKKSTKNL